MGSRPTPRVLGGRAPAPPPARTRALLLGGLAILAAASACGDSKPRATGPRPPVEGGGATSAALDSGAAGATAASDAGPGDALTEAECRALVDHVVGIALTRFRQQAAEQGKPIPTEAQLQEIREGLGRELGKQCLTLPRRDYDCAMRAENAAAIEACATATPPVEN